MRFLCSSARCFFLSVINHFMEYEMKNDWAMIGVVSKLFNDHTVAQAKFIFQLYDCIINRCIP